MAAYDGAAALTALDEHHPDLVLLDLGMPGMDGYEVARRMREARPGQGLVIAAVTGWSDKRVANKVVASGLDLHLTKPLTLDTLIAVLRERGR
jgi:CheY-like chemotaxis protein